ncbi:hypothetical protein [Actinoplanes nipponensis]
MTAIRAGVASRRGTVIVTGRPVRASSMTRPGASTTSFGWASMVTSSAP